MTQTQRDKLRMVREQIDALLAQVDEPAPAPPVGKWGEPWELRDGGIYDCHGYRISSLPGDWRKVAIACVNALCVDGKSMNPEAVHRLIKLVRTTDGLRYCEMLPDIIADLNKDS